MKKLFSYLLFSLALTTTMLPIKADLLTTLNKLQRTLTTLKEQFETPGAPLKGERPPTITALSEDEQKAIVATTSRWRGIGLTLALSDLLKEIFNEFNMVKNQVYEFIDAIEDFKAKIRTQKVSSKDFKPVKNAFMAINGSEKGKLPALLTELYNLSKTIEKNNQNQSAIRDSLTGFEKYINEFEKYLLETQRSQEFQKSFTDQKEGNIAAIFLEDITQENNKTEVGLKNLFKNIENAWGLVKTKED